VRRKELTGLALAFLVAVVCTSDLLGTPTSVPGARAKRAQSPTAQKTPQPSAQWGEILVQPVQLEVDAQSVRQVVGLLNESSSVEIALREEDLPPETRLLSFRFDGPLGKALDRICADSHLAWGVEQDRVVVGNVKGLAWPMWPRVGPYPSEEIKQRLGATIPSLSFADAEMREVVGVLQEISSFDVPRLFLVLFEEDLPEKARYSSSESEDSLEEILNRICTEMGLAWKVEGRVVKIASPERLRWAPGPRVGDIPPEMKERLLFTWISFTFLDSNLTDMLALLRETTGIQFATHIRGQEDATRFTWVLEGSALQALDLVCELSGTSWKAESDVIKIGTRERLLAEPPQVGSIPLEMKDQLAQTVSLDFSDQSLPVVLEFLGQITEPKYELAREDVAAELPPVTLTFEGPLRRGLDLVCWLSGTFWKAKNGTIRVGTHEAFMTPIEPPGMPEQAVEGERDTPLHVACGAGQEEYVGLLLAKGADVNARDAGGRTPLHVAVMENRYAVADLLLQHGADVSAKSEWGGTALHSAVRKGNERIVRLLLREGADMEADNHEGNTPLHEAAEWDMPDMVRLLLEYGADPNAANEDGSTPLHLAVDSSAAEEATVRLLLSHGADVQARNGEGQSVIIDFCISNAIYS